MTTLNAIACVVLTGTCVFPAVSYAGDDGHPAGAPRMGTGIKAAPNDSGVSLCGVVDDNRVLVDFATDHPAIESVRATVHKGDVLNVTFRKPSGFVRISAPEAGWNLNAYVAVAVDLENNGSTSLTIKGKINRKDRPSSLVHLEPGQADTMLLYLSVKGRGKRFGAMSGAPGGDIHFWGGYDKPLVMRSLELGDLDGQAVGGRVAVKAIRAVGKRMALHPPGDDFFPFVDAFGQYRHQTWTNKVHSVDQLKDHGRREIASIRAYPRCPGWSRFGGWARGPRLAGTGHFRTQEHDGRWWFVDPEGYLFWSIGSNGVRFGVGTRVKGREHYFASIPDEGKKTGYVDFSRVNMQLKYGETWRAVYIGLCHDRLSSWGMNSCGNWSDPQVYLERRTPYVVAVNLGEKHGEAAAVIRGNEAVLQKTLRRQLAKHARSAEDPWCIGYFIDNELSWKFVPDIDMYFRIVREEMRVAAPNKLYLGSRIHDRNPEALAASATHCDVVSINCYRHSPIETPRDVPYIVGEFHFGALDRGMLSPGLRSASNQRQRAHSYRHYMRQAILRPNIVGAHWFTFREQALTGRGDGENYQVGLVDVCDTPYAETIDAIRETGRTLYDLRSGSHSRK